MQKIKPYLAIYNASKNTSIANVNFDLFETGFFEDSEFCQKLSTSISSKVKSNTPIIIINAQALFPKHWFARLETALNSNDAINLCSALTCHVRELSPLLDGDVFFGKPQELDKLLYLMQKAGSFYSSAINYECFVIKDKKHLKELDKIPHLVCNNLLVQSYSSKHVELTDVHDIGNQKPLPAHPLAKFHWRIKALLDKKLPVLGYPILDSRPIMLHINMGWGGGVYQWINDYCRHEDSYQHLILSSAGELYRKRHGETLTLHYQQTDGAVMQEFELQSPIASTCIEHPEYKQILEQIIADFQVQQLLVSSLIGHSMECLQTGLPTLRVLHDYFPSWPSLIAHLDQPKINQQDLEKALKQSKQEPFGEISYQQYENWKKQLHKCYQAKSVKLVAPSVSVVENLRKIDAKVYKNISVIPHAIEKFSAIKYSQKPNKKKQFEILVLGRISPPKGQELLEEIIAGLGKEFRFTFFGAGNEGKKYLNTANINVIMDYKNSDLPQQLQQIEPDIAIITSQTSETFNYTLSELQQAGICVISTKLGALKNRIVNGKTGFLCENNASAFIETINILKNEPEKIKNIRSNLKKVEFQSFNDEIKQIKQLLARPQKSIYQVFQKSQESTIYAKNLIATFNEKKRINSLLEETENSLEDRTKWGKTLTKQLKKAEKNIDLERQEVRYLKQLIQQESERMTVEIDGLKAAFSNKQSEYETTLLQLQQTIAEKQEVATELSDVYNSRSWRVTKPLRRFTTWARHKRNALKFRWAQIKSLPTRTIRSLKTRGVKDTIGIAKNKLNKQQKSTNIQQTIKLTQKFIKFKIKLVKQPKISIIVPVYNHFEHTYNCLKSISKLTEKASFEVIVIDDCSSDNTSTLIQKISGIRYHRQEVNGGFIESCNTGAKMAQGQYLMFLNNDTVVYKNWLDALIEVFDNNQDAGLVGSKLVYPDNQLQEAGGIVFSDASGWNYGRLGNPDEPQYNHVREVDYCSGASILITKSLFKELGYFDERYKPAYYEDTDLAFAVRKTGKKVYYQPYSKVTHFEGISSGTDLTTGMKKYQVVNQAKFKEKWSKQLLKQPKSGTDIEMCRIHSQPKRILIFDACTPTPDQDSGSLRMINIIKILKELGYHVIFMPENLSHDKIYTQTLQQLGVECIYTPFIKNPVAYLKEKGKYLDAVMLSRYYVAEPVMPFIREYCPKAQIIFDTVDLHYVREQRMAELTSDKKLAKIAENTKKRELAVAKVCDVTLVVSPYEVGVLSKELSELKVNVLTNIHEIYGCRKPFKKRRDIMFIGGYQHTPNVDALEWFVTDIFPLIEKQLPDLKFHIVGSRAPKQIQEMARDNIVFQGFVEDIEPFMDDIRIAIAPLRYGAGVKGKVNMSMSYGQPVVGTKVAVEGMFTVDEKDCLMAQTPEQFAKQVVRLYQDEQLWNQISQGGLNNVQKYFSFAAAKQSLDEILT